MLKQQTQCHIPISPVDCSRISNTFLSLRDVFSFSIHWSGTREVLRKQKQPLILTPLLLLSIFVPVFRDTSSQMSSSSAGESPKSPGTISVHEDRRSANLVR